MKRILSILLAVILMVSLCACQGNFGRVNLSDPIPLPEDGLVSETVLEQIKRENAIGVFTGSCGEFSYEWTIFGSDITEPKEIDLSVLVTEKGEGIQLEFSAEEDVGFPVLLSVHLQEKWPTDRAILSQGDDSAIFVSVTGSKTTILNLSIKKMVAQCVILPEEDTSNKEEEKDSVTDEESNETSAPAQKEDDRDYSDGQSTGQDQYQTDPVPEGKPMPVEPENQEVDRGKAYTCTFSIECSTILNNLADLDPDKLELIPSDGVILPPTAVTFYEGESVFDVIQRACKENNIHLEFSWTPVYNSAYIEGIHNLYEFDCGALSGWMYRVNGWYPNYGCSRYQLADGELVEWRYTCDLGQDVGCEWMQG